MSDRPKKSWKEIDALRDGARRERDRDDRKHEGGKNADRSSQQYRAALDALFEKGGFNQMADQLQRRFGNAPEPTKPKPEAAAAAKPAAAAPAPEPAKPVDDAKVVLRKKLLEALSRDDISRAFDKYAKAYGMPMDFELLEQGLEHIKPARQAEVLEALAQALERNKPKRAKTLAGKLRFIEETGDPDLRATAAALRAKL
jgi:hypothetical protein